MWAPVCLPSTRVEGASPADAETMRDARDLVKLAVLGRDGGPEIAKRYYTRALPELKSASKQLDELAKLLPR